MKFSRRTLINASLACLVMVYIIIVVPLANRAERNDTFRMLDIRLNDPENTQFLKTSDVYDIMGVYAEGFDTLKRKDLNTLELERLLNSHNRVEKSSCRLLSDGTLVVSIDPIAPVARVFDSEGSVYVNATGKRVPADPKYHIDVPVVITNSTADTAMVRYLLPILNSIKENPGANALVSSLRVDDNGDIIIIPNVVGHVINFGDTSLIDNKFERLHVFYKEVMPVRGWNAYDTISIKWAGRVTATKRDKTVPDRLNLSNLDNIVDETIIHEQIAETAN